MVQCDHKYRIIEKNIQLEVHSIKGKSPCMSSLPLKLLENQKIRFSWKTPFVQKIAATSAKRVKFSPYLTYKGETCPNAHLLAFDNGMDMDSHTNASWYKSFILTLTGTAKNGYKAYRMGQYPVLMCWLNNLEVIFHLVRPE